MKRAHNIRGFSIRSTDLLAKRRRYFTFCFITADTMYKNVIEKRKLIAIIFNAEIQRTAEGAEEIKKKQTQRWRQRERKGKDVYQPINFY